uniref:Uncharacterized protein n=1 Tax=Hemiselmis andersenii TaxID=464988 RepID=A0A7S0XRA9_HEMAN
MGRHESGADLSAAMGGARDSPTSSEGHREIGRKHAEREGHSLVKACEPACEQPSRGSAPRSAVDRYHRPQETMDEASQRKAMFRARAIAQIALPREEPGSLWRSIRAKALEKVAKFRRTSTSSTVSTWRREESFDSGVLASSFDAESKKGWKKGFSFLSKFRNSSQDLPGDLSQEPSPFRRCLSAGEAEETRAGGY